MGSPANDFRFAVPPLPPHHISRPRLLATLDDADATALTLVSAGAGAGKTVLLSDWARRQTEPVVWLALTPEDNDPRRFWRLLLEGGQVGGQVYPPSAWVAGRTVELLDSVYGRSVAQQQPRLAVVLDDAHLLTDPQIVEGLDRLVERWASRLRLLMTARSDPLVRLHRYRLAGQVCEIRAAGLAMTDAEAHELLAAHGVPLPAEDVRVLTSRTEGWAAGLRLAALRMQGTSRPADFVAVLAMDQGSIGEYLTAEVLARQSDEVTRLLVETSFLDQVTGPLADAVTGRSGCGSMLIALARTNSFVIPLDAEQTTFRYHQLFREVLRHLANRQPAHLVRSRYARAAGWYREQGDLASALRWTIRSQDPAATRTLLLDGGLAEAFTHSQDLAEIGLEMLADAPAEGGGPGDVVDAQVARWAIAAVTADGESARAALRELTPLGPELGAADPAVRVTAALAQLILGQKAGDHELLDAAAERLLDEARLAGCVAGTPGLRASVLLAQARSRFTAGRLAEVEPLLRRALAEAELQDVPSVLLQVLSVLAFVTTSAGRLRHADDAIRRAGGLIAAYPGLRRPVTLDLAGARRAEMAGDWTAMDAAVARVVAAGPVYPDNGTAATVAFVRAVHLVGCGELAAARTLLRHNRAINGTGVGALAVLRDVELAGIDIRLGRPHAALRVLEPHQRPPFAVAVGVTAARAHLALGELRQASACIRAVLTTPSAFVTRRVTVEAVLCEAEIADRNGAESRATELLDQALLLADDDFRVSFIGVADAFAALLARHPALAARWPVPVSEPPPWSAAARQVRDRAELLDPLTLREQAVLRLMPTRMSTAEMADELHLSINTVKTHLAAIYRKLAVNRRRDAVFRARELELL